MDNKVIKEVYRLYSQPLYLYALSLCKNKADAEDLVATTFVKALTSCDYKKDKIKSWLYTVLKNEFINMYRKNKRFVKERPMDQYGTNEVIHEFVWKEEKRKWLYHQIQLLKPIQSEIMLLSYYANLSDEEISRVVQLSIENVRVIKYRVKKDLIKLAKEEDFYGR